MTNRIFLNLLVTALLTFMFCDYINAQTQTADYYNVKPGTGKGLRFWLSDNYKIDMGNASSYKYGPVTDYSIKMNMNNSATRGWTWGVLSTTPVAALNTQGNFQIKGWLKSEGTLISTAANSARYVRGSYGLIHRNDGSNYHMLLTASGDQYGNWNNLRPFRINNASGSVHMGNNTLNVMQSNGRVGIGTTSPNYKLHVAGDVYSNWVRTAGNTGLRFQSHGGGFYMKDNDWIRTFGNKNFYHNTGIMRTDGTFQVGGNGGRLLVRTDGKVGIGTTTPDYKLDVNGTIRAKRVKVESGWSDYVFYEDYQLPTLDEEEKHIEENGYLLGFESEEAMGGMISLGDVSRRQQAKIEEIVLHLIELKKENDQLKEEIETLKTNK